MTIAVKQELKGIKKGTAKYIKAKKELMTDGTSKNTAMKDKIKTKLHYLITKGPSYIEP